MDSIISGTAIGLGNICSNEMCSSTVLNVLIENSSLVGIAFFF